MPCSPRSQAINDSFIQSLIHSFIHTFTKSLLSTCQTIDTMPDIKKILSESQRMYDKQVHELLEVPYKQLP